MDYPENCQLPGLIVPQVVFSAPQPYARRESIRFTENGRPGILLRHACSENFSGMADRATYPTLTTTSMKITIRINWPGYPPWAQQMHAFTHASVSEPITKQRLAYDIARLVNLFLNDMANVQSMDRSAPGIAWSVPNIRLDDLVLLELRHVSTGSWQPVLCRMVRA
ncbi:hypothetical protein PHLCEN_2v894 [Hermanssonia centrifuga]|uniref:Uncharacterized protein n=1 Tax=Hermanssonia centrifuga TaxID=98765 RepID=A0A2R6S4R1_9APHY|nr:hypothetical protein PHLCEN_2v894 [Hermanssonia centrifuga]